MTYCQTNIGYSFNAFIIFALYWTVCNWHSSDTKYWEIPCIISQMFKHVGNHQLYWPKNAWSWCIYPAMEKLFLSFNMVMVRWCWTELVVRWCWNELVVSRCWNELVVSWCRTELVVFWCWTDLVVSWCWTELVVSYCSTELDLSQGWT